MKCVFIKETFKENEFLLNLRPLVAAVSFLSRDRCMFLLKTLFPASACSNTHYFHRGLLLLVL